MKKKVAAIVILLIILLSGVLVFLQVHKNIEVYKLNEMSKPDNVRFSNEYVNVPENNIFVYLNEEEAIKFIKSGTGAIVFGFPECEWCQKAISLLSSAANESNIDKIYYYNPKEIRKNNTEQYREMVNILSTYLKPDDNGNKRLYVPDVYVIRDGKVLGNNNEVSTMKGDSDKYFTSEVSETLKKEYVELLSMIK